MAETDEGDISLMQNLKIKIQNYISKLKLLTVTNFFLIMELASLNLLKIARETETDRREFPRALVIFSLVSTANVILNEKIRDKIIHKGDFE